VLVIGISSCESSLERSLAVASNPCDPSCDPPTWCGVATTLCAGEEETPSLVEKLHSGFQLGDQERRLRCTRLSVLWALAFACRHRLGGVVQDVIGRASVSRGCRRLCRTTLHDRVYSGVCIPLALTSLLTVLRFRIYSILHAFTFLVSLIRIGYRLQVFRGK